MQIVVHLLKATVTNVIDHITLTTRMMKFILKNVLMVGCGSDQLYRFSGYYVAVLPPTGQIVVLHTMTYRRTVY